MCMGVLHFLHVEALDASSSSTCTVGMAASSTMCELTLIHVSLVRVNPEARHAHCMQSTEQCTTVCRLTLEPHMSKIILNPLYAKIFTPFVQNKLTPYA